jgi:hypothetical protein
LLVFLSIHTNASRRITKKNVRQDSCDIAVFKAPGARRLVHCDNPVAVF